MEFLVSPHVKYEEAYRDMLERWRETGETPSPWVLEEAADDFAAFGTIGYGVCPWERRKGYAASMPGEALAFCKARGMRRVLLGCYRDNVASARTILHQGGVLENREIERYWIALG